MQSPVVAWIPSNCGDSVTTIVKEILQLRGGGGGGGGARFCVISAGGGGDCFAHCEAQAVSVMWQFVFVDRDHIRGKGLEAELNSVR